jgi:hypothetical protein
LDISDTVIDLAEHLIRVKAVPKKAIQDSYHVAVSAVHGMDDLLTWNCNHIANVPRYVSKSNKRVEIKVFDHR